MSNLQHNLFIPTCCNPCLVKPFSVKPDRLSKCQGCKLILYCSVAHQKFDWRIHRQFCQAISAILDAHKCNHVFAINGSIKNPEDLNVTTLQVKYMITSILDRKLSFHEEELTSFPVMCAVCYTTNLAKLYQCKKCNAVSYCCEEHEKQDATTHSTECLQLKIYYCKHKIQPGLPDEHAPKDKCNIIECDLKSAMKAMFGIEFPADPSEELTDFQKFSYASDFSCISTISYVVKHLDMKNYRGEQFTIYVAGATIDSLWFAPQHVQFFMACFPQIRKLNVIFVGPELLVKENSSETFDLGEGRTYYQASEKKRLEDYFLEKHDHLKPNLMACFNCGFSENTQKDAEGDIWYKGIRYMMEMPEVPILFTSYTSMEADFDFGTLIQIIDERKDIKTIRMERLILKQQNPYRDLRPLRSWQFNDPERIYYRNGYVQAVSVKLCDF